MRPELTALQNTLISSWRWRDWTRFLLLSDDQWSRPRRWRAVYDWWWQRARMLPGDVLWAQKTDGWWIYHHGRPGRMYGIYVSGQMRKQLEHEGLDWIAWAQSTLDPTRMDIW